MLRVGVKDQMVSSTVALPRMVPLAVIRTTCPASSASGIVPERVGVVSLVSPPLAMKP